MSEASKATGKLQESYRTGQTGSSPWFEVKSSEQGAGREVGFVGRVADERAGKGGEAGRGGGRERERASLREVFGRLLRSFYLADLS